MIIANLEPISEHALLGLLPPCTLLSIYQCWISSSISLCRLKSSCSPSEPAVIVTPWQFCNFSKLFSLHHSPPVQITYENVGQHSSLVVISITVKKCLIFTILPFVSFNHFGLVINPQRRIFFYDHSISSILRALSKRSLENWRNDGKELLVHGGKGAFEVLFTSS